MSETKIHPTAIVDPSAQLGEGVEIGPHAVIEAGVTLGDRCKIGPMVHIQGTTVMGPENVVYTGATLGFPPQFIGFDGSPTRLIIGARNTFREYVSVHRGLNDQSETTIGNDCFFMGSSHIAHDCHVGNNVILANGALLAGHVTVGDRCFISGNSAVHQFCRIGRLVMVGGLSAVNQDVPPFMMVAGDRNDIRGLNVVGLRRAGISSLVRREIKRLLREIYYPGRTVTHNIEGIDMISLSDEGKELVNFYKTSKRGVASYCVHKNGGKGEGEEE